MAGYPAIGVKKTGWCPPCVMAGLVPAIHDWRCWRGQSRGWPGQGLPRHKGNDRAARPTKKRLWDLARLSTTFFVSAPQDVDSRHEAVHDTVVTAPLPP